MVDRIPLSPNSNSLKCLKKVVRGIWTAKNWGSDKTGSKIISDVDKIEVRKSMVKRIEIKSCKDLMRLIAERERVKQLRIAQQKKPDLVGQKIIDEMWIKIKAR